jgi:hypothetical protein
VPVNKCFFRAPGNARFCANCSSIQTSDILLATALPCNKTTNGGSPYLTGSGGAAVTVFEDMAQIFDPDDPNRPVKAFLQEYQPLFGFGPEALDDANVRRDCVSAGNGVRTRSPSFSLN